MQSPAVGRKAGRKNPLQPYRLGSSSAGRALRLWASSKSRLAWQQGWPAHPGLWECTGVDQGVGLYPSTLHRPGVLHPSLGLPVKSLTNWAEFNRGPSRMFRAGAGRLRNQGLFSLGRGSSRGTEQPQHSLPSSADRGVTEQMETCSSQWSVAGQETTGISQSKRGSD